MGGGRTISIENLTTHTTVLEVKRIIEEREGIPIARQKILLKDENINIMDPLRYRQIRNEGVLGYYEIEDEAELLLE